MNSRMIIMASVLSLVCLNLGAQEGASWKVVLNKKTILVGTNADDTAKNHIRIKKADLSNNGVFKIDYTEAPNSPKGWNRSIAIFDTSSTAMVQRDSTNSFYLYNRDLMKVLWSRKKVIVYTWSMPSDPSMAAAIRLRRIPLCTIESAE
ncbi:MAG: hypothetical protein H7Y31_08970 [Chitinophagaceae bacterium]|nr:hypothetical protein [Chitinophagaceae bacterium]